MSSMVGQFIVDNSGQPALDDGTTATLESNFTLSIDNRINSIVNARSRTKLTGWLDMYVNGSTGNDGNNGLTSGTAFRTLQRPVDLLAYGYDMNQQTVTVHVADGVYTGGMTIPGAAMVGGGLITFVGNVSAPASCKIALSTAGNCIAVTGAYTILVKGFALESTPGTSGAIFTTPGIGMFAGTGGTLLFSNIAFGPCTYAHMASSFGGYISVTAPNTQYSIYGGAVYHIVGGSAGGSVISIPSSVLTISNPVTFNTTVFADSGSLVYAPYFTYVGAAVTGTRYYATNGGYIATQGVGPSFFPGSSAGANISGYVT